MNWDETDHQLVRALQAGLPLTHDPWSGVANDLGLSTDELLSRVRRMQDAGAIRRIAAVPNHIRLGSRVNGMTVWDVDDDQIDRLGRRVGALECVSHCYLRPRHAPLWPYNLFAMVHGRDRAEAERHIATISQVLGSSNRASDVLYSKRILKKTGLRFTTPARSGENQCSV